MKLLEVVAFTDDRPEKRVRRGQVGTIVESLAAGAFEVEFCDLEGRTFAMIALPETQLMVLHHEPAAAAAS